jgi:hypothetical protein
MAAARLAQFKAKGEPWRKAFHEVAPCRSSSII